ncbi:hypothetical protein [Flavobacterium sp. HJJ]|uniref:hypothetical protein n=1 Tax=Flavobacterium sp. HJJ TaxID=2783792 RepID=UPI00188A9A0F|nr:hypothetical protein [Flavobacterium sp. HJJ]MBF4473192.1 hypothetical protein [Flavobacterium sp. HJJ]
MWSKLKELFASSHPLDLTIIDETNLKLDTLVKSLMEELITKNICLKLEGKKVEIIIPKDFGSTVYKYAIDEEKAHYDANGFSTSNGNFSITTENNIICFKLIINSPVFEDSLYLSTITHEFTHAVDFSEYINRYSNPFLMNSFMKNKNYYREFYLWTEYNAKKKGLLRYQKELDKDNLKLSITVNDFIHDVESEIYSLPKLYSLMHFFARVFVCNNQGYKFNMDNYVSNFLICKFGSNVFSIQTTIEKIKDFKDFEKKKVILKYLIFP